MRCSCALKLGSAQKGLRPHEGEEPQTGPAFICWLMYSACRSAKATMVKVGFAAPGVVRTLPSEMNRFLMS